eukprot:166198-Ditylum_brightwellii.AAC.1
MMQELLGQGPDPVVVPSMAAWLLILLNTLPIKDDAPSVIVTTGTSNVTAAIIMLLVQWSILFNRQ